MAKFFINLGLFVFLIFSSWLTVLYFDMLIYKIEKPTFKNLDTEGFAFLGVLIIAFVVIDFFIVRRFFRSIVKEVKLVKKEL